MPRPDDECPVCALRYGDFRAPERLSYADTYRELRREHDHRIETANDYSLPPKHAAILGRMHQRKREAWEQHIEWCALEAEAGEEVTAWAG